MTTTASCRPRDVAPVRHERSEDELASLASQAAEGDPDAWRALWTALDSRLESLVRQRRLLGGLSQNEDDRREVVLRVMGRLQQDGFRRLRLFVRQRNDSPGLSLVAWLTVVARNAAIDYLRAHPDFLASRSRQAARHRGTVADILTLPPPSRGPGLRPPVTAGGTARQLLEYAGRELPEFQCRSLELWVTGHSASDIAQTTGLATAEEAERSVRAALEKLRRHFRADSTHQEP